VLTVFVYDLKQKNSAIKIINLCRNAIGPEGAKAIGAGVAVSSFLRFVDFSTLRNLRGVNVSCFLVLVRKTNI